MTDKLSAPFFNMPITWHCVKCEKDYPAGPMDEAPYAIEVIENPRTGRRVRGGEICRACYFGEGDNP